ncbi:uncharacterized protein LOC128491405 [Spea bombifrons]|uniref:uncharacterized protein LOC128491405 n=1 Tax=Spea bombifrons TaxID=233779 RepID=UPI00234977E1|nr:uncharacterized protein LOC128491405 [Spea bombifrons]
MFPWYEGLIFISLCSDRVKVLEREQSEKDIEIRKLKAESGAVLRIELDVCKQQLDLERSHRAALQDRVGQLESRLRAEEQGAEVLENNVDIQRSQSFNERSASDEARSQIVNLQQELEKEKEVRAQKDDIILLLREELEELKHKKPGEIKASLEEVDSELIFVREELQKVWDMLKIKDTELEEQYQELKSARGQYTECSNENLRLEQLVVSLQKQLTESEQTVKRLKHMREVEKTELDIERSSLELKLAEAREQAEEASSQTGLKRPKEVQAAEGSHLKCARCDVFLLQLDKAIKGCQGRNVELQEEKSQVLASLHQLQEILKDVSKQTKMNENVAQTLQVDNETLKKQHNLVTEQLKNLFKEKQNLGKAYNKLPKEEIPKEEWAVKSKLVKNVLSAIKDNERHQEELGGQIDQLQENEAQKKEMRSLERQLDEKSDQISSMASEIKTLREKNESLMKAKLRFQQQVQQIRSISQPHHEKELTDPSVPRLSADPVDAHQSIKAEFILSGSQESLAASAESQASFQCPSEGSLTASPQNSRPGTPLNPKVHGSPLRPIFPGTAMKSWKRSSEVSLLSPRSQADSEATNDTQGSLTPRASALLSPRPYRPQKTIQTFKFRDIQEQSIN